MPITIQTNKMQVKNDNNEYISIDAVSDATTAERVAAINAAASTQIAAIENKGVTTRESIPDDYTTLSDDVSDLKSAIRQISIAQNIFPTWYQGYINTSTGIPGTDNNYCYCDYIESNGKKYEITGANGYKVKVARYNSSKVFQGLVVTTTATFPVNFTLNEGEFFRIQFGLGDSATTPSSITPSVFTLTYVDFTDTSLSMSGKAADAKATMDAIDKLADNVDSKKVDITNHAAMITGLYVKTSTGEISTDDELQIAVLPCVAGIKYTVVSTERTCNVGLANTTPRYGIGLVDFHSRITEQTVTPTSSTQYLVIYAYPNTTNFKIYKTVSAVDRIKALGISMHDYPQSSGVVNTVKRAKQSISMRWIPAADLPRVYLIDGSGPSDQRVYKGIFKGGTEYSGVPYSQADYALINDFGYTSGDIGSYISPDTFVSAVQNADSVLYDVPVDGYGYRASFYGLVCCSFCCRAFNLPTTETYRMTENTNPAIFVKSLDSVASADPKMLRVGGFMQNTAHVALITDIWRNEDGEVIFIEVTEETRTGNANRNVVGGQSGGITRCKLWSTSEFKDHFGNYTFMLYKYIDNVTYESLANATPGYEPERFAYNSLPCMPYMGNKFTYRKSHLANKDLLISNYGYTHLRVLKDGASFALIAIEDNAKITPNFTDAGYYKAHLCTIDANDLDVIASADCEWCVVEDTTTATISGNVITIVTTVDAHDVPYMVRMAPYNSDIKYRDSTLIPITDMTVEDIGSKKRYTITVTRNDVSDDTIRVEYQGTYNKWNSDWMRVI